MDRFTNEINSATMGEIRTDYSVGSVAVVSKMRCFIDKRAKNFRLELCLFKDIAVYYYFFFRANKYDGFGHPR